MLTCVQIQFKDSSREIEQQVNPYPPNVTFLYLLKTSEKGYRNVTLREYGLNNMNLKLQIRRVT